MYVKVTIEIRLCCEVSVQYATVLLLSAADALFYYITVLFLQLNSKLENVWERLKLLYILKFCVLLNVKCHDTYTVSKLRLIIGSGLKYGPARVGPTDGGAFEVSMTMDGWRQLRNDWLLLLHHECVSRR